VKGGTIKYIAIDGYRIATNKKETDAMEEMEFVVHAKDIRELTRIFEKDEAEELKITADKKEILILGNDIKTKTKLLEGEYIKYEAIIPTEKKIKVKIDKAKFHEALQRVSSIIKEKGSSYVKILFAGGEAELTVDAIQAKRESERKASIFESVLDAGVDPDVRKAAFERMSPSRDRKRISRPRSASSGLSLGGSIPL
jgi:DNA polymerase III sliding clamp (beta) subunit (PCNA family)